MRFIFISQLIIFIILNPISSFSCSVWLEPANEGNTKAQLEMGWNYAEGKSCKKDLKKAFEWFKKAADKGHVKGQAELGWMYSGGKGVKKDLKKAYRWFKKAADQGHVKSQMELYYAYKDGKGVNKDKSEAIRWLKLSASGGYEKAIERLKRELNKFDYYIAKAQNGDDEAQLKVGKMYLKGNNIKADTKKAIKWLKKSADQGNYIAQSELGFIYSDGIGVKVDDKKAFQWFKKSADQGFAWAQMELYYAYEKGKGVKKDIDEAIKWLKLSALSGNEKVEKKAKEKLKNYSNDKTEKKQPLSNYKIKTSNYPLKNLRSLSSYEILKGRPIEQINDIGNPTYIRLITSGDFNNDGLEEFIGFSFSKKYIDYVWDPEIQSNKKNDDSYFIKGSNLSKDPSWYAKLNFNFISTDNKIVGNWDVSTTGDVGCVHPSQIIPSHLNSDSLIDFVIVCHGYDAEPFPGENSFLILSNGVDSYSLKTFTKKGYYHDGATADFNKDGKLDILLVDSNSKKIRVYLNDGDGNFTLNNSYFPQFMSFVAYHTEILDVNEDGFFDVYLGGDEFESYGAMETIILLGNKENKFSTSRKLRIPSIKNNGVPLDILKYKDYLFILRTGSKPNFYKGSLIQQVDLKNMETVSVIENKNIDHWLDRLFEIKVDIGPPKFGSFSYKNRGIEFVFEDNKMRLTSN